MSQNSSKSDFAIMNMDRDYLDRVEYRASMAFGYLVLIGGIAAVWSILF